MEIGAEQNYELMKSIDNLKLLKYLHEKEIDLSDFKIWADPERYQGFSSNNDGYELFSQGLQKLFDIVSYEEEETVMILSYTKWTKLIEIKGSNYINEHFEIFKRSECNTDGCSIKIQFTDNSILGAFEWEPSYFADHLNFFIRLKNEIDSCLKNVEEAHDKLHSKME